MPFLTISRLQCIKRDSLISNLYISCLQLLNNVISNVNAFKKSIATCSETACYSANFSCYKSEIRFEMQF